jgi:hypothetical protein
MMNDAQIAKAQKAEQVLARALSRYDRRADAYVAGDPGSEIWLRGRSVRTPASAMGLVKQARDLAGRLERMVYDGVGL